MKSYMKSLALGAGAMCVAALAAMSVDSAAAKTRAQMQAEADRACDEVLRKGTASALLNFRLRYRDFDTACSTLAYAPPSAKERGDGGNGVINVRGNDGNDGGQNDGGQNDGGQNDGGQNDGGQNDGGQNDGGQNDGGENDGGQNDGGENDGGENDGKGNNGHGNDDDGDDDSNPGHSNDPDDDSDDDGAPGNSGNHGKGKDK